MIPHRNAAQPMVVQHAAIQAAIHHRHYAAGRSFVVSPQPATITVVARRTISPEETSRTPLGLEAAEIYLIKLTIVSEDVIQGELLRSDGLVLYSGTAESRVDSLLEMLVAIDSHTSGPTHVELPVKPTSEMQTSHGHGAAEAYSIRFADIGEGVFLAELISSDGEILCSGEGDDRSDGLQAMLLRLVEGGDPSQRGS